MRCGFTKPFEDLGELRRAAVGLAQVGRKEAQLFAGVDEFVALALEDAVSDPQAHMRHGEVIMQMGIHDVIHQLEALGQP